MLHFGLICTAYSRMFCQISEVGAENYFRKRISFDPQSKDLRGCYIFRLVILFQRRTKSENQVARATKYCKMAPNNYRYSEWNLLHITNLTPRILWWRLGFLENFDTVALRGLYFDRWTAIGFSYIESYYSEWVHFKLVYTQLFIRWWRQDPQYCVSFVIEIKRIHRAQ
jgi:hypothetical protein